MNHGAATFGAVLIRNGERAVVVRTSKEMRLMLVLLLFVTVIATGCGDDESADGPDASTEASEGAEGGACYPNGTCDGELTCASEFCVNASAGSGNGDGDGDGDGDTDCPMASAGCSCTGGGVCDGSLSCLAGYCVDESGGEDCPVASPGCACTGGGSCDTGLSCVSEFCVEQPTAGGGDGDGDANCPVASAGCACTEGGVCDGSLSCLSGSCVDESGGDCPVASKGCACTGGGSCDTGLSCVSEFCVQSDPGPGGDGSNPPGHLDPCSNDDQCTGAQICGDTDYCTISCRESFDCTELVGANYSCAGTANDSIGYCGVSCTSTDSCPPPLECNVVLGLFGSCQLP